MTACGGIFIGGEFSRNEQCPHEADLRRLSLRDSSATLTGMKHGQGGKDAHRFNFKTGFSITWKDVVYTGKKTGRTWISPLIWQEKSGIICVSLPPLEEDESAK